MITLLRKYRRWKYAKRCIACKRKFMWKHVCRVDQLNTIKKMTDDYIDSIKEKTNA